MLVYVTKCYLLEVDVRKRSFTLIELLIVISIIAILAGLSLRGITTGIVRANRTESNSNLRQITTTILGQSDSRSIIGEEFLFENGVRTLTSTESGHFAVDGLAIESSTPAYQIFKHYKGAHPFDEARGYYVCMGNTINEGAKRLYDSEVRLVMEIYPWDKTGDGKVGVAFADGRVETLKVTTPPSEINILEVMSIRGAPEGKL